MGEGHLSLISNLVEQSTLNLTFGYAGKVGRRWPNGWGLYIQAEHNLWTQTELELSATKGALNLAVGGEYLYFNDRMRFATAFGSATLLQDTAIDDAGTTGVFFDWRPTGLRWSVGSSWTLVLDPMTFSIVMPVLSGIPLLQAQYRGVVGLEFGL